MQNGSLDLGFVEGVVEAGGSVKHHQDDGKLFAVKNSFDPMGIESMKDEFYQLVSESESGHLPVHELKGYRSYRILSRSSHVGIWLPERDAFIVWREGYGGKEALTLEYHCDIVPFYTEVVRGVKKNWTNGTVKPFFEIEKSPFSSLCLSAFDTNDNDILDYLRRWCVLFPADEQYNEYWKYLRCVQQGLQFYPSKPLPLSKLEVGRAVAKRRSTVQVYWNRRNSRVLIPPVHKRFV